MAGSYRLHPLEKYYKANRTVIPIFWRLKQKTIANLRSARTSIARLFLEIIATKKQINIS